MKLGWPNSWRYTLFSVGLWLVFLVALLTIEFALARDWPAHIRFGLACVPFITVVLQFRLSWATLMAQDEIVRGAHTERFFIAAATTLIVAIAYSTMPRAVGAPELPIWIVYPLFWGVLGVVATLRDRADS
jgi:hypothetical protein